MPMYRWCKVCLVISGTYCGMKSCRGEYGLLAFLKRFIIIHTPKAAVMVMFWQSLDSPSILGMVLEGMIHIFTILNIGGFMVDLTFFNNFLLQLCLFCFYLCF